MKCFEGLQADPEIAFEAVSIGENFDDGAYIEKLADAVYSKFVNGPVLTEVPTTMKEAVKLLKTLGVGVKNIDVYHAPGELVEAKITFTAINDDVPVTSPTLIHEFIEAWYL